MIARIRDEAAPAQAFAEIGRLSANVQRESYGSNAFRYQPILVREHFITRVRPVIVAMVIGVGLLLMIMASNLATLTLAQAARRSKEFAVRRALPGC